MSTSQKSKKSVRPIVLGGRSLSYECVRKKIKNVNIRIRPDGSIAVIVLNSTDGDIDFVFRYAGKLIRCTAESHSIATYVIE